MPRSNYLEPSPGLLPGAAPYDIDFRIVRPDGACRIAHEGAEIVRDDQGTALSMVGMVQDITNQRLLMRELDHRVKNNLAVVVSLAKLCLQTSPDLQTFSGAFIGRIMAMARAHEVLASAAWHGLKVAQAIEVIVLAPLGEDATTRIATSGPNLMLPGEQAMPFCMTLHELTSNALKYGALAEVKGHLDLEWHFDDGQLTFVWRELGGPASAGTIGSGMGTRLMRSLATGYVESLIVEGARAHLHNPIAEDILLQTLSEMLASEP